MYTFDPQGKVYKTETQFCKCLEGRYNMCYYITFNVLFWGKINYTVRPMWRLN